MVLWWNNRIILCIFVSGMLIIIIVVRMLNFMFKGKKYSFLWNRVMYGEFVYFVSCVKLDFVNIVLLRRVVFN